MNIYYIVLLITVVLAFIFKRNKKAFVISTAMLHLFVSGFRYNHMHGDLMKYHFSFLNMEQYGWTSQEIINGGRNTLFFLLNKFVYTYFNQNFQVLLFIIAAVSTIAISILIYKHSPKPFVSFVLWSCFGFFMFSFYSLKQTLAMAFLMFATDAIFEKKRQRFYLFTIIAGFIHMPALIFLPAFELCKGKKIRNIIFSYIFAFIIIFIFRDRIVGVLSDAYYYSDKYTEVANGTVGGKTFMMLAILAASYLLCDFHEERSRKLFILISVASLLQLFSVYNNVFTRLSDYYFQFIILLGPYMLEQVHEENHQPLIFFTRKSRQVLTIVFLCLALLFYYRTCFRGVDIPSTDNLVSNFAFMWQVQ